MKLLRAIDEHAIAGLRARGEFLWLDLESPDDDEIRRLGRVFGFHPMAVQDTLTFGQRPKLDDYETYMLLVFYGVRPGTESRPELGEVHLFVSGDYVVTIRREDWPELAEVRRRFEQRPPGSEQFVLYRILDTLTDTFFPVLDALDEQIDTIQDEVLQQPTDEQLQRIFDLKRMLIALRRVVTPERDLFARAIEDIANLPGLEPDTRDYLRDVYDHLIRISDLLDSYRDLLTGATDVYLSTVSNRLNVVMKQLTVIATIFLPLTFLTGFFGQNFQYLIDAIHSTAAFYVLGLGLLLIPVGTMLALFRRRGYF